MVLRLLKNRDFLLSLGLVLGIFANDLARFTQDLALPTLAVVMTLSTLGVSKAQFQNPQKLLRAALWGIALNYLLLSSLILAMSRIFEYDRPLYDGFVILAAVPPAVAVIPFTDFLDGDRAFSLLATMGAYLGALFIMPVLAAAHWQTDFISPFALLKIVLLLIVLPVAAAQALRLIGLSRRIEPVKGAITNWCFFLVTYTIVGLNSEFIRQAPGALFPVMAAAFFSTFGLGVAITLTGRILRVPRQRLQSMVLLGTLKNYGLAGGLALALFSQKTALPAVVSTTFMVVYIIWLGFLKRRTSDSQRPGPKPPEPRQ